MSEKYDDVLLPFLSLMRRELHANCGKGDRPGWLAMSPGEALLEVYYHLAKLQKAVRKNDGPAIQEYSADVANMAMMVLDICGGLAFGAWDASQITQPNWAHVQAAFIAGACEARANPDASEEDFLRASDGYTKLVFEEVDPVSETAMRTGNWKSAWPHTSANGATGVDDAH